MALKDSPWFSLTEESLGFPLALKTKGRAGHNSPLWSHLR